MGHTTTISFTSILGFHFLPCCLCYVVDDGDNDDVTFLFRSPRRMLIFTTFSSILSYYHVPTVFIIFSLFSRLRCRWFRISLFSRIVANAPLVFHGSARKKLNARLCSVVPDIKTVLFNNFAEGRTANELNSKVAGFENRGTFCNPPVS